jgi:phospholipid-binding lipoprotein MlaA
MIVSAMLRSFARLATLCLVLAVVAGCATRPDSKNAEAVAEFEQINDPAEPTNRAIFEFNRAFDSILLKPLAKLYRDFTPQFFQDSVHNFLNNLRTPVILANDVLQGEFKRAGQTIGRFLVNSTVGVGGLMDVAAEMGVPFHGEDFGQTLAVWGVPEGPYVMLPIIGPSNPRDAIGLVVDFIADPLNLWAANTDREWIIYSRTGMRAVDIRARNYDALEDLERTSLDYYAAIRSLYRQRRADEIRNGKEAERRPAPGLSRQTAAPEAAERQDTPRVE